MKNNIFQISLAILILFLISGCAAKEKFCNVQNECKPFIYSEFTFYDVEPPFDTDELCRMAKQIISKGGYSFKEECTDSNIHQTIKGYGITLQVSKGIKNYQFSMMVAKEKETLNYFFAPR